MATDSVNDFPSMPPPVPKCWRCRVVLDRQPKFCPECGADLALDPANARLVPASIPRQPVIEQGRPMRPQYGSPLSRPLTSREMRAVQQPHTPSGFTDTLSVFKNSGPLGKSVGAMLEEYKQRSQPQIAASGQQPPPQKPPTAGAAPQSEPQRAHFDTGDLRELPTWLQGAAQQPPEPKTWQIPDPKPLEPRAQDWLLTSGKSHAVFSAPLPPAPEHSGPVYRSDPTMKVPRVPKAAPDKPKQEPYPPLPDNTIPCTRCHGCGVIYPSGVRCPANCNNGRVLAPPAPIPQPPPDVADAITGRDATPDERAMLSEWQAANAPTMRWADMQAAERTGPTDLAIEAVQVAAPAQQPKGTDPKLATPAQVGMRRALISKLEGLLQWQEQWLEVFEHYADEVQDAISLLPREDENARLWRSFGKCYAAVLEHLREGQAAADIARGWLLEAKEGKHGK